MISISPNNELPKFERKRLSTADLLLTKAQMIEIDKKLELLEQKFEVFLENLQQKQQFTLGNITPQAQQQQKQQPAQLIEVNFEKSIDMSPIQLTNNTTIKSETPLLSKDTPQGSLTSLPASDKLLDTPINNSKNNNIANKNNTLNSFSNINISNNINNTTNSNTIATFTSLPKEPESISSPVLKSMSAKLNQNKLEPKKLNLENSSQPKSIPNSRSIKPIPTSPKGLDQRKRQKIDLVNDFLRKRD